MAEYQTRIRTRNADDGTTEILVLVSHPMETGQRVDATTKEKIPAHFIQRLTFTVNGKEVAQTNLSQAVSKDPVMGIRVKSVKPGDKIRVTWSDNKGEKGEGEIVAGQG